MVKFFGLLVVTSGLICQLYAQQADYNVLVNAYILKFKDIAINEMRVYRVPASITLAQGILESNAGRSKLAVEANNHFGIKCHKEWNGMTIYHDDDVKNECFRKYNDPLESFRDHSKFLTQRERYKRLFELDIRDYKGWAHGLKSAGYATNPTYAQLLIKTVETFLLDRYDRTGFVETSNIGLLDLNIAEKKTGPQEFIVKYLGIDNRNIYENNRLNMIIAREDDNLYVIARDFNISVSKLLKYNDLPRVTALKPGQVVYLNNKRRKGEFENHKVQKGESLYDISQLYGIRLKLLYKRNDLQIGAEPRAGAVLRLR
ncbi:MAG: glucosaminidase domain-containing protein [Bacteroidales bacterium]|nr:glucosaminidase domain-containing protein [Bacteroidales bacterium]